MRRTSTGTYYGDVPQSLLLMHQLAPENASRYSTLSRFFQDAGSNKVDDFPSYCFKEPAY